MDSVVPGQGQFCPTSNVQRWLLPSSATQVQNAATHLTVPKTAPYNIVIQYQMSRSATVEKSLYSGKNPGCEIELPGLESRTPLHLSVQRCTKDVLKDHSSMPAVHVTWELPNPRVREEPRGMEKEARPGFSHLRRLTSHSTTEPRPSSYPKLPPAHTSLLHRSTHAAFL